MLETVEGDDAKDTPRGLSLPRGSNRRACHGPAVEQEEKPRRSPRCTFCGDNKVPAWQRRGTGLSREEYQREGFNPKTQEKVLTRRRRIRVDDELPMKDAYSAYLRAMLR